MTLEQIKQIEIGTTVSILMTNKDEYYGIYDGIDSDDTLILKSKKSTTRLGLPIDKIVEINKD